MTAPAPQELAEKLEAMALDADASARDVAIFRTSYERTAADLRAAAALIRELSEVRQKLANSLFRLSVAGNHVALVIGADHPPYTESENVAGEHYGSDMDKLNSWICWSIIMDETRTVYDRLPEEVKSACWQWWNNRRAAKALERPLPSQPEGT